MHSAFVVVALLAQVGPANLDSRRKQLADLLSEHWEYTMRTNPEYASVLGDKRYNDRITDFSEKAIYADIDAQKQFLARFLAIDVQGFPEQDALNHALMVRQIRVQLEGVPFKDWEMPVSQFGGIHINAPQLVSVLSFETVKDYDDYISRLRQLPTAFAQIVDLMRHGVADKLVPPRILLEQVARQSAKIAEAEPEANPFFEPAKKMPAGFSEEDKARIREQMLAAIRDGIRPAYQRFTKFVQEEYAPRGRAEPGIWALPDGAARYAYIDQMWARLPQYFGRLPKAKVEVMPVEAYREKEASGAQYVDGTPDGKRPGHVMVNTGDFEKRTTLDIETTAYHEVVPGHHLQVSIAQELPSLPPFRQHAFYIAFIEGWGLYSERLGEDAGFFQDPYSMYGHLQDNLLRAIRLVVDTGFHLKRWTRQQVVDYFHANSGIDEPTVQSETDRYMAWPAQALGYKIGQLKILELRDRAKKELGPRFDIRSFHDELLGGGAMPLDVLEKRMDGWIAQTRQAGVSGAALH